VNYFAEGMARFMVVGAIVLPIWGAGWLTLIGWKFVFRRDAITDDERNFVAAVVGVGFWMGVAIGFWLIIRSFSSGG
jgi:hypothetical protein